MALLLPRSMATARAWAAAPLMLCWTSCGAELVRRRHGNRIPGTWVAYLASQSLLALVMASRADARQAIGARTLPAGRAHRVKAARERAW